MCVVPASLPPTPTFTIMAPTQGKAREKQALTEIKGKCPGLSCPGRRGQRPCWLPLVSTHFPSSLSSARGNHSSHQLQEQYPSGSCTSFHKTARRMIPRGIWDKCTPTLVFLLLIPLLLHLVYLGATWDSTASSVLRDHYCRVWGTCVVLEIESG